MMFAGTVRTEGLETLDTRLYMVYVYINYVLSWSSTLSTQTN